MRIKLLYIIIPLLILIGFRVFHQFQSEIFTVNETVQEEIDSLLKIDTGVVAVLIPRKTYYRIGESPQLDVVILNRTDSTIYLPGYLDGSANKTRQPYSDFKILNRNVSGSRFIDVMPNPLVRGDLKRLQPNDCFNPINDYHIQIDTFPPDTLFGNQTEISISLENFWSPESLDGNNFLLPGSYDVQFVYCTIEDTTILRRWNIHENFTDFDLNLLDSIPEVDIKSNIVTLKYRLL